MTTRRRRDQRRRSWRTYERIRIWSMRNPDWMDADGNVHDGTEFTLYGRRLTGHIHRRRGPR